MQKMAEGGMTHGATHVFTMDNIDWKKNTLGGEVLMQQQQ